MKNENSNVYYQARIALKLTRERASELSSKKSIGIAPERIERIENKKIDPQPIDSLVLAQTYDNYELCNYHCTNECPIGQKFMPKIKVNPLEKLTLEILSALNSTSKKTDRLIEIAADGQISEDEIADFVAIQEELNKISLTVDALKLWSEQMLASGKINREKYEEIKNCK